LDQLEELIRISGYMKMLDETNAKIIGALSKYDPRNIAAIAKTVNLPNSTLAFRIKKLMKKIDLELNARVDFTKLGLAKAIIFTEALPGRWNTLWNALEDLGYLTYVTKCHGKFYGCYSIFAFPANCKGRLREYFDEAKRLKAISNFLFFWTTNLCEVHPSFDSYDFKNKRWIFQWEKLIEEIKSAPDNLSEKLLDPKDYPIMADDKDLILLRYLEKNGVLSFKELAKVAKMSPRNVAYRYKRHLIERKLIIDHMASFLPYPYEISDFCSFVIDFENEKALAKFANSLDDKIFILSYAKVLGENTLIINTCLPKTELPQFMELLNSLAEVHLVKRFFHVVLTLDPHKRGGVPYEFFKEDTWMCNIDKNIEKLKLL
jgi:DNA-binding Lrp family transcriptional regulator